MARFGLLVLLAAALGGVVATPVQDEQVLFPGTPDKRWDWTDCGRFCPLLDGSRADGEL